MSADNFWYVRLDGDKYVVTMEYASDPEPRELRDTDQRLDTVDDIAKYIAQREDQGDWTEYGVAYGPGVSERMVSRHLVEWLEEVRDILDSGQRPDQVNGPLGRHLCTYDIDDDNEPYVTIAYSLPAGFFAEIDDKTYGTLEGFRIYFDRAGNVIAGPWNQEVSG